jgi:hypothetical protein
MQLPTRFRGSLTTVLGAPPIDFEPAQQGFTPAVRGVVTAGNGQRAFLKAATDDATAGWLRAEWRVYRAVRSRHVPRCLHFEPGERPWMLLEDLSDCAAPPPWQIEQIEAVEAALGAIARVSVPAELPRLLRGGPLMDGGGWPKPPSCSWLWVGVSPRG